MNEWATRTRWRSGASAVTKQGRNRPGPPAGQRDGWSAPSVSSLDAQVPTPELTYTSGAGFAIPEPAALAGVPEQPLVTAIINVDPLAVPVSTLVVPPYWSSGAVPPAAMSVTGLTTPNVDTGPGSVYMVPLSIDPTGLTEVANELSAFFASVPNGSTIMFQPGATYLNERGILLTGRSNLIFDGNGGTMVANTDGQSYNPFGALQYDPVTGEIIKNPAYHWRRQRSLLRFDNCSGIEIRNVTLDGANKTGGPSGPWDASLEAQMCVWLAGCTNTWIHDCTMRYPYGDTIYGAADSTLTFGCNGVTIEDCTLGWVGRQIIAYCWGTDFLLRNCTLRDGRRSAIDFEPVSSNWSVVGATVQNNLIQDRRLSFIANHGSGRVDNVVIEGNTCTKTGQPNATGAISINCNPSDATRRANWIVRNNTGQGRQATVIAPINFQDYDGIEVYGNYQQIRGRSAAIPGDTGVFCSTLRCCNVSVHDNTAFDPNGYPTDEWVNDPGGYVCP